MMKILGAVLIIGASTLFGYYKASLYAARPRQIRQLIHALKRLATEIGYGSTPLPEALARLSSQCSRPLNRMFGIIADRLRTGSSDTAKDVWQESVRLFWGQTAMKSPERETMLELGSSLGISDRENQLKHIELAVTLLQHEEAAARDEQLKYEKLSRSLGVLGGALIVILIY